MSHAVSPAEPPLRVSHVEGVCTLTLNRPAALNSFTAQMHGLLLPALESAATDAAVKVVVITGAGRGFCAGQDLNDPAMAGADGAPPDVGDVVARYYRPLANRVRSMPVPVIAAIHGTAITLIEEQQRMWGSLSAQLRGAGLAVIDPAELTADDRVWLEQWFMERIFPVLTPLAIDPAHPFPVIPSLGLVMVLKLTEAGVPSSRSMVAVMAEP